MTDELYERYKEALRTGHVAVLRGQLEAALAAYAEAAEVAPARALPHTSLGGVYLRLGRVEEALAEYAAAVARAPNDEGALLGQAEALTVVGRRSDAAVALDRVSEIQEAAGRLPEASDTLRRALDLDEAPERMRRQRSLQRQIRLSAGDQAAELQLARALRIREDVPQEPVAQPAPMEPAAPEGIAPAVAPEAVARVVAPPPAAEPVAAPIAAESAFAPSAEPAPDVELAPETRLAPEPAMPLPVEAVELATPEMLEVAAGEPATDEEELDQLAALRLQALNLGDTSILDAGESATEEPEAEPIAGGEPMADEEPFAGAEPASERPFEPEPEPVAVMAESAEPAEAAFAPSAESADLAALAAPVEAAGLVDVSSEPRRLPIETEPPQPSGDALLASAEAAEAVANLAGQRTFLLDAARAYAREGRFDAGIDAAHRVIGQSPGDVDAHLVLVELYVSRSWDAVAAEKLLLLGRLADLDDDETTRLRLCAAASQAFPGNTRLQGLCS